MTVPWITSVVARPARACDGCHKSSTRRCMFRERHRMKLAIAAAMTVTMTMTGALATAQAMENAGFLEAQWHPSQIQLLAELQKERRRVIRGKLPIRDHRPIRPCSG